MQREISTGSKHIKWALMPDGRLTDVWTTADDYTILCIGGSVLAGKVDMFPAYEALFSLQINDLEHIQSDICKMSLYKSAQEIFLNTKSPIHSRDITFFQQKGGEKRSRYSKQYCIIESFLRALAVQGCGLFLADDKGVPYYSPNKAITIGMFNYPLAINTGFLLRSALVATLDGIYDSTLSSWHSSPRIASTSAEFTPSHATTTCSRPITVCIPSGLSIRSRHDVLDVLSSVQRDTEVRALVSSSVATVAAFLSNTCTEYPPDTGTSCAFTTSDPAGSFRRMKRSAQARLCKSSEQLFDAKDCSDLCINLLVVEIGRDYISASVIEVENPDTIALSATNRQDSYHSRDDVYDMTTMRVLGTCGTCLYGWTDADMQMTRSIAHKEWTKITNKVFSSASCGEHGHSHSPSSPPKYRGACSRWMRNVDEVFARVEELLNDSNTGDTENARAAMPGRASNGSRQDHRKVYSSSRRYVYEKGHSVWAELVSVTASHLTTSLHTEPDTVESAIEMAHCLKTIRLSIRAKLLQIYYIVFIEHASLLSTNDNSSQTTSPSPTAPHERHSESGIALDKPSRQGTSHVGVVNGSDISKHDAHATTETPLPTQSHAASKRRSSWTVGMSKLSNMFEAVKPQSGHLSNSGMDDKVVQEAEILRKERENKLREATADMAQLQLLDDDDDDEYVLTLDRLYLSTTVAVKEKRFDSTSTECGMKVHAMGMQDMVNKCVKGAIKRAKVLFIDSVYDGDNEASRSPTRSRKSGKSPGRRKSPRKRSPSKKMIQVMRRLAAASAEEKHAVRVKRQGWQRSYRPADMRRSTLDDESIAAGVDMAPTFSPVDGVLLYVEGRQLDDKDIMRNRRSSSGANEDICNSVGIPGIRDAIKHAVFHAGIANHVRVTRYADSILFANTSQNKKITSTNRSRAASDVTLATLHHSLGATRIGTQPFPTESSVEDMGRDRGLPNPMPSHSDTDLVHMTDHSDTTPYAKPLGHDKENILQELQWVEMSVGSVWDGSCLLTAAVGESLRIHEAPPTIGIRIVRLQDTTCRGRFADRNQSTDRVNTKEMGSGDDNMAIEEQHTPFSAIDPVTSAEYVVANRPPFPRSSSWDALKQSILTIGANKRRGSKANVAPPSLTSNRSGSLTAPSALKASDSSDDVTSSHVADTCAAISSTHHVNGNKIAAGYSHSPLSPIGRRCVDSSGSCEGFVPISHSRVLWLAGSYPDSAVEEGLPSEEADDMNGVDSEDEGEDEAFYDEHIEKYVGRTLFCNDGYDDDDEENEDDEAEDDSDVDEESIGTFASADSKLLDTLRPSQSVDGNVSDKSEYVYSATGTTTHSIDDDGFGGRRDDGVILATHSAWQGGFCSDITALLMCKQSSNKFAKFKNEDDDNGWVDVWGALPQPKIDSGSLSGYLDMQRDISARMDSAVPNADPVRIELDVNSPMIAVVREKRRRADVNADSPMNKSSGGATGVTGSNPGGSIGDDCESSASAEHSSTPNPGRTKHLQKYIWAVQVVQLCDSPLQKTRSVRVDSDGDLDGVSVICTIPLCKDNAAMTHSCRSQNTDLSIDSSFSVHIHVDDVSGVVSCTAYPVEVVMQEKDSAARAISSSDIKEFSAKEIGNAIATADVMESQPSRWKQILAAALACIVVILLVNNFPAFRIASAFQVQQWQYIGR